MRAQSLSDLLKEGDRVAVSNVTGREAAKVSCASQLYCKNIVAGWALGKGGQRISIPKREDIRVFGQFEDLMKALPEEQKPNKIVVYSPPDAVYGDVKEVVENGKASPDETFLPGSACIISNSGNMVNTIATYLQSAGLGVSYGISTGKDVLILTPPKDLLALAAPDERPSLIVLHVH